MAENKGGSDLDVFEGLAKKKPTSGGPASRGPTLPGAVPSQRGPVPPPPARQKTLLGITPNLPPPTPSQRGSALPPPAPPARPSALPVPPAPGAPAARPSMPLPPPSRSSMPPPPPPARPSLDPQPAVAPEPPAASPAPTAASASPEIEPEPILEPDSVPQAEPPVAAAPSVPAETPSSLAAPIDMDWDDDDEKTTIFDRGDAAPSTAPLPAAGAPASRTLVSAGAPSAPIPAAGRPAAPAPSVPPPAPRSVPPAPATPQVEPPAPSVAAPAPSIAPAAAAAYPPAPSNSKTGMVIGLAVAGAALLGLGVFAMAQPKDGKIAVFVAASGGRSVDDVSVLVNGVKKCDTAPCRVELPKGVHEVKAIAPGYAPITQGVTVVAGEEQAVNLSLSPASAGTGIRVAGPSNVTLWVDGQEVGPLPQELKDLTPGQHTVAFKGGDRYVPEEKVVNVVADQIQDLGTVQLKLAKATAKFDVRTTGASLTLVSGSERIPVNNPSNPVELDATKNWRLEASRSGFEDLSFDLDFGNEAEKTFVVQLSETPKAAAPAAAPRTPATQAKAATPKATAKASGGGTCKLNINSIPVSNVILNGRPLGGTPKLGVSVPAGSHTVIFVHPELGRKSTRASCSAGETKTVAMRLNK